MSTTDNAGLCPIRCPFPEDWAQGWLKREKLRKPPDDVSAWDSRAADFGTHDWNKHDHSGQPSDGSAPVDGSHARQALEPAPDARHALEPASSYVQDFLQLLAPSLQAGDTILDMGAGNGSLALPLAATGYHLLAADFSPGMLAQLQKRLSSYSQDDPSWGSVQTLLLDFNAPFSDWQALGITDNSVDIAIASRSTMVADLGSALEKLERVARRSVAITMAREFGPRSLRRLGEPLADGQSFIPDYIYGLNILLQRGRYPRLSWIDSCKPDETRPSGRRLVRWAFLSWDIDID